MVEESFKGIATDDMEQFVGHSRKPGPDMSNKYKSRCICRIMKLGLNFDELRQVMQLRSQGALVLLHVV